MKPTKGSTTSRQTSRCRRRISNAISSAARLVSQLAVGAPTLGAAPASHVYRVPRLLEQDVRTNDDLPFGSRGGLAVRHQFVLDGEYVFKVRLRRQVYDYIIGMGTPQQLEVRLDGQRVKRFTVGGEAAGTPGPLTWNGEIVGDREYELYMHAADAGLEVRVPVTAGAHLVTASFVDNTWEPEGVTAAACRSISAAAPTSGTTATRRSMR